jgi:hypothetical protein
MISEGANFLAPEGLSASALPLSLFLTGLPFGSFSTADGSNLNFGFAEVGVSIMFTAFPFPFGSGG